MECKQTTRVNNTNRTLSIRHVISNGKEEPTQQEEEDIQNLIISIPKLNELFNFHHCIGEGTFSSVYLATLKNDKSEERKFAVKHIVPTCHPERIRFELKCLKSIGGQHNIVGLNLCLREKNNIVFVMPYHEHEPFNDYVGDMDSKETAHYLFNLLKAVAYVHKHGIIHRDIKPSNFLYNRRSRTYMLVDFGLAQIVKDCKRVQKRKRETDSDSKDGATPPAKRPFFENCLKKSVSKVTIKRTFLKENDPEQGAKIQNADVILGPPQGFETSITKKDTKKQDQHLCKCYGKPTTCSICIIRKNLYASRAGTPGFRPPEVLIKSLHQTTAIDVWAVGVILLCILSNCTNFFASPDDMTALSEIITLFGSEAVEKLAIACGRHLICSEKKTGIDLQKLCCQLRSRSKATEVSHKKCANCYCSSCICLNSCSSSQEKISNGAFPSSAYDILKKLLDVNPNTRISATEALKHDFFAGINDQ